MITNASQIAQQMLEYLDSDEYFDITEEQVSSGSIGFGNPHSKLTSYEQFHLWKKLIKLKRIQSRDEFCNIMAQYSTYEQALKALGLEHPEGQV